MARENGKNKLRVFSIWKFFAAAAAIFLIVVLSLGAVGTAVLVTRLAEDLPTDDEILAHRNLESSVIYDRNGKVITTLFLENRRHENLNDISRWMIMSTLAAEDSSFYTHMGIRPVAVLRSIFTGSGGHGASTITQQLARNLFLTQEQTMLRKGKEAILSLRLEKLFSKDNILEAYLNTIYFGHGAWGINAASHAYFGKEPSELTLTESSILAGLVAAPGKYSPIRSMEKARSRQRYVLQRMVTLGWIDESQKETAETEELVLNDDTKQNILSINGAPYFVSHLLFKYLLPKYGRDGVYSSGLQIRTTLDLDLQEAAESAMEKLSPQGAIVALDPDTGEILAMVGGHSFEKSKFNRATQAYRQPGSSFKPILYTAALEKGFLPTDHILDRPITYELKESVQKIWSPTNYGKKYAGEIPLFVALTHSYNTPAVRLTDLVGPEKVVEMARKLGITSPHIWAALSIGLGTASVTPLEMASVYSVFGNGGNRVVPYGITEIKDRNGKILELHSPKVSQALEPSTAIVMRSMLMDVVKAGTGSRAAIKGYEVFGKTGTTNDFSDAWFAGGIPGLVTVVYAGNDDHKSLGKGATGSKIALPIWKEFMDQAVALRTYPASFTIPEDPGVVKAVVCRASGYLATGSCRKAELYLPENVSPESMCPIHGGSPLIAMEDQRAPRLLLLPQDESYAMGGMAIPGSGPSDSQGGAGNYPIAPPVDPYLKSPVETPDVVEERYQELLQQYGLSN